MNSALAWTIGACIFVIGYTYLGYPVTIAILAAIRPRKARPVMESPRRSFSIVMAVRNEAGRIERRAGELSGLVSRSRHAGELIIVCDGSSDGTPLLLERLRLPSVRIVRLEENVGKSAALSAGCSMSSADILVFADARQEWETSALDNLLETFTDSSVGGVSGELVIRKASSAVGGVGLYWRYEKWLRAMEGRFRSTAGASGSISAVRRALFRPIPKGLVLDDLWWPMHVIMQGYKVVQNPTALAFDIPADPRGEFQRKVRTLSGNFQLVQACPELLLPWRNPIWFEFVSHKLLRVVVPWVLAILFISSMVSLNTPIGAILFAGQCVFYLFAILSLLTNNAARIPLGDAVGAFTLLNAAAWWSFWVWLFGRSSRSWTATRYK